MGEQITTLEINVSFSMVQISHSTPKAITKLDSIIKGNEKLTMLKLSRGIGLEESPFFVL
jgi:hypothetical protein